jgi:hypothetical protein
MREKGGDLGVFSVILFLLFDFVMLDLVKLFSSVLSFPLRLQQTKLLIPSFFQWPLFPGGFDFLEGFLFFRPVRTLDSVLVANPGPLFFRSMFFSRRCSNFFSPASQLVSIRASGPIVFRPPGARPDSERFIDLTEPRLLLSRSV